MLKKNQDPFSISILIATHDRDDLIKKLLSSLLKCVFPQNFNKIFIIENGSRVSENTVTGFTNILPIVYFHLEEGNKSNALNYVINKLPDNELVIFFDDDVEIIEKKIIVNYYEKVKSIDINSFYGGSFFPNYETPPPPQLNRFFPYSVRGFNESTYDNIKEAKMFYGCNWACFVRDLKKIGLFNPLYGPGSKNRSRGQETSTMIQLKTLGISPVYVENSPVSHYVPSKSLSLEWILDRNFQNGRATSLHKKGIFHKAYFIYRFFVFGLLDKFKFLLSEDLKVKVVYELSNIKGYFSKN